MMVQYGQKDRRQTDKKTDKRIRSKISRSIKKYGQTDRKTEDKQTERQTKESVQKCLDKNS
jgi:hypothetical protein